MSLQNKKSEMDAVEKSGPSPEQSVKFEQAREETPERKEISRDEKLISDELRKEIEMMELDGKLKVEAEKKAEKIEYLGEKEKIEHLLKMAREKGLVFSIQVAKKTGDPYVLDILHDTLSKEGFYKEFTDQGLRKTNTSNAGIKFFVFLIMLLVVGFSIFLAYKLWK